MIALFKKNKHFTYSDNPEDPCTYCVQWEQLDPNEEPNEAAMNGHFVPMMPTYCVIRLYVGFHEECMQMIDSYIRDSNDGL